MLNPVWYKHLCLPIEGSNKYCFLTKNKVENYLHIISHTVKASSTNVQAPGIKAQLRCITVFCLSDSFQEVSQSIAGLAQNMYDSF
jgi:hypothetical protein